MNPVYQVCRVYTSEHGDRTSELIKEFKDIFDATEYITKNKGSLIEEQSSDNLVLEAELPNRMILTLWRMF